MHAFNLCVCGGGFTVDEFSFEDYKISIKKSSKETIFLFHFHKIIFDIKMETKNKMQE